MPNRDVADLEALTAHVDGQPLTEAQAEGWIPRTCFKHGPPGRIGIELEFLVHDQESDAPRTEAGHLDPERLGRLFADLEAQPLDSSFTVEPGGQVELSSRPGADLTDVISALERDLELLREPLARHRARLVGAGIDPFPPPPRYLNEPRYDAMEQYFDRWGTAGRAMMRASASVQVNVEAAHSGQGPSGLRRRWDLLHAIGPALVAAFANSSAHPVTDPGWAGHANLRPAIWLALDPARCRAPRILPTESLPDAWTRWVLDAPLLAVRRPGRAWTAPGGLSFRRWLVEGRRAIPDASPPTLADLRLHLSTLFPPVRARGHFEVRYLDAQPGPLWRVPAAVIDVVLTDDAAADAALAACEPVREHWRAAARHGLAEPALARAARQVLAAASGALDRLGRFDLATLTAEYLDRRADRPTDPTTPEAQPC